VVAFRQQIAAADGVLFYTPDYILSLPESLKNALEWCVSTKLFSGKPVAFITASASGESAHEELRSNMETLGAKYTDETLLLVKGIMGKFAGEGGRLTEPQIIANLMQLIFAFDQELEN
jgi:NAD(P)H-dependent FMN reductase